MTFKFFLYVIALPVAIISSVLGISHYVMGVDLIDVPMEYTIAFTIMTAAVLLLFKPGSQRRIFLLGFILAMAAVVIFVSTYITLNSRAVIVEAKFIFAGVAAVIFAVWIVWIRVVRNFSFKETRRKTLL